MILCLGVLQIASGQASTDTMIRFPAEWEPHELTFMQWPQYWKENAKVQAEIATVAKAIADYERVVMLVSPDQMENAQSQLQHRNILIEQIAVDDLWARDTMPSFRYENTNIRL